MPDRSSTDGRTLAICGGNPAHRRSAPKYPRFDPSVYERIAQVLEAGPMQGLSKAHPIIGELEQRLGDFHGVEHCLSALSGHGALHSALIGLEITSGDEVITSPYSWGSSVSCILHNGAMPVFADVLPDTGLLDPVALERALSSRTRAILVPHIYGQPADMTAIMSFARRRGLAVIEDGSQAHGARHRGVLVGAFGDAAGFSINGIKPLATTEGGYMVTSQASVYWNAVLSCQHAGRSGLMGRAGEDGFPDELRESIDSLIYTYRPNLVTAILALDRLPNVEDENEHRRRNIALFERHATGVRCIALPAYPADDRCAPHMLTLNFDPDHAGIARDTYLAALQAEGVPAMTYVERGLHTCPRLSPAWSGPRVMWTETVRRSGIDPTATELPGCDRKVATSIEIPWNYPEVDEPLMQSLASAFVKVDEGIGALRSLERAGTPRVFSG